MDMAASMGIEVLTERTIGNCRSWENSTGRLRYDNVFTYHNGAE